MVSSLTRYNILGTFSRTTSGMRIDVIREPLIKEVKSHLEKREIKKF